MKKLFTIAAAVLLIFAVAAPTFASKGDDEDDHKITICHVSPGNGTSREITIDKEAWENGHSPHNAHSLDYVGTCRRPDATPTRRADPTPTRRADPTARPSDTPVPTDEPTRAPTETSEPEPTNTNVPEPTVAPTDAPTKVPTSRPTVGPTSPPSQPTATVPVQPTATDGPVATNTPSPSDTPVVVITPEVAAQCTCSLYYTAAGEDDDRLQFALIGVLAGVGIISLLRRRR